MKTRLLSAALLFAALTGLGFADDAVKVRIKTVDKRNYSAALVSHDGGAVLFNVANDPVLYKIPDAQIASIEFPLDKREEEARQRLFDEGNYKPLAEQLQTKLTPLMPYASLPSNLNQAFLQWMTASYWIADYDRTLALAAALQPLKTEGLSSEVLFYSQLAKLAQGDFQTLETFLKTPDGDRIYPPGSAVRLYIDARLLQRQAQYIPAIRTAARLMARHSRDTDWIPQTELLCAELYFQLDMPESARAVLADIKEFYSDPQIQKQAAALAAHK
jgi:hypothetical protein